MNLWIPEEDTGTRMWKCPQCGGRMIGKPMDWDENFNPYYYCPYCGKHLKDFSLVNLFGDDDELY